MAFHLPSERQADASLHRHCRSDGAAGVAWETANGDVGATTAELVPVAGTPGADCPRWSETEGGYGEDVQFGGAAVAAPVGLRLESLLRADAAAAGVNTEVVL